MNSRKFEHFELLPRNFLCITVGEKNAGESEFSTEDCSEMGDTRRFGDTGDYRNGPGEKMSLCTLTNDWTFKEDTGFQIATEHEAYWCFSLLRSLLFSLEWKSLWKLHSEIMERSECMPACVFLNAVYVSDEHFRVLWCGATALVEATPAHTSLGVGFEISEKVHW